MSLTLVSYSMIDGAAINPNDYGADPTGVADSTSAINAALLAASSKALALASGATYLVSGSLLVLNGVYIEGNGATLKAAVGFSSTAVVGSTSVNAFMLVNTASPVTINGVRFEGFNGSAISANALMLHATNNLQINNCYFSKWGRAGLVNSAVGVVPASYSTGTNVSNCVFDTCGSDTATSGGVGYVAASIPGDANTFSDCVMYDPTNHGFDISAVNANKAIGCSVIFTGAINSIYSSGFYISDNSALTVSGIGASVIGCSVINESATEIGNGVKVSTKNFGATVDGCKVINFKSSVGAAINVQDAVNTVITNSYITMGVARHAIYVVAAGGSTPPTGVIISNNTVVGFNKNTTAAGVGGEELNTGIELLGFAGVISDTIVSSNSVDNFFVGIGLNFGDGKQHRVIGNKLSECVNGININDIEGVIISANAIYADDVGININTGTVDVVVSDNYITSGLVAGSSVKTCIRNVASAFPVGAVITGNCLVGKNTTAILTYAISMVNNCFNILIANNQCTYTGTLGQSIVVLATDVVVSGNMTAGIALSTAGSTNVGNVAGSNLVTANY